MADGGPRCRPRYLHVLGPAPILQPVVEAHGLPPLGGIGLNAVELARPLLDDVVAESVNVLPGVGKQSHRHEDHRGIVIGDQGREAADADADSAAVGAARSISTVGMNLVVLLARLGRIGDPGMLRFAAEIQLAVETIFTLADRHGIPAAEVQATIERLPLQRVGLGEAR